MSVVHWRVRPSRIIFLSVVATALILLHFFVSADWATYTEVIPERVWSSHKDGPRHGRGSGKGVGRHGKQSASSANQQPLTNHPLRTLNEQSAFADLGFDDRGIMTFDPKKHKKHPVELLIERGKRQEANLRAHIGRIKRVKDAVADYEDGFGMKPPRGFEYWYKYARANKCVLAPSLFPMAQQPYLNFLSLPAAELRRRLEEQMDEPPMYWLQFVPDGEGDEGTACEVDEEWDSEIAAGRGRGRVKVGGTMGWKWRCNNTLELILPLLPSFPPEFFTMDPPLTMLFNTDDGPRGQVSHGFRQRAESLGRAGRVWPADQVIAEEKKMEHTHGWHWACPDDSPLKRETLDIVLNDHSEESGTSPSQQFVADFYMSMDVCYNPDLRELLSAAIQDERFSSVPLVPYISPCRTLHHSDIVMVPLDAQWETPPKMAWSEKTRPKLFWRGSPTGVLHAKDVPWRKSQRERLHNFANNKTTETHGVIVDRTSAGGLVSLEYFPINQMNERWFDIGLSGNAVQCEGEECDVLQNAFEWKDVVREPASLQYKFIVDVDGNAWSSRFRRLLLGNNVVLKSTMYPEWFSNVIVPWYHFVPIRADYKDVYDIMAFFEGAPDGSTPGRDDLAEEIARQAVEGVEERWREEDMRSFMFLMMLEYFRMMHDDREAGAFTL